MCYKELENDGRITTVIDEDLIKNEKFKTIKTGALFGGGILLLWLATEMVFEFELIDIHIMYGFIFILYLCVFIPLCFIKHGDKTWIIKEEGVVICSSINDTIAYIPTDMICSVYKQGHTLRLDMTDGRHSEIQFVKNSNEVANIIMRMINKSEK